MTNPAWEIWTKNFNRIGEFTLRKKWTYAYPAESRTEDQVIIVKAPVVLDEIIHLESDLKVAYPDDFVEAMTQYASAVLLSWHMGDENNPEFAEIFCGGGNGYIWDFNELRNVHADYLSWIKDCFNDPEDDYGKVYYNKVPFISVPNGDIIAFEKQIRNGVSPVIYLSHDDGELHGHKLANSFTEFITKWSNIGCVGTEEWQMRPFYDFEKMELKSEGEVIDRWKKYLNGK